jgi:hypothetical protein
MWFIDKSHIQVSYKYSIIQDFKKNIRTTFMVS